MDPTRPKIDANPSVVAWPRTAQLAVAFLLGVGSTLLAVRLLGQPAYRPSDLVPGPAVDVNRAGHGELVQLPGVGPSRADHIIAQRDARPIRTTDDLRTVSGVGKATVDRIRPFVATDLSADGVATAQSGYAKKPLADQPLDLNSATVEQLQTLPGIGPKLAERIVTERFKRPFESVEELRRVGGIGPKTLEKLRPHIIVRGSVTG